MPEQEQIQEPQPQPIEVVPSKPKLTKQQQEAMALYFSGREETPPPLPPTVELE